MSALKSASLLKGRTWRSILGVVLLTCAACVVSIPAGLMVHSTKTLTQEVAVHNSALTEFDTDSMRSQWASAKAYNDEILAEPTRVLGEVTDPWGGGVGPAGRFGAHLSFSLTDQGYQAQLPGRGDHIMATITYPAADINLPIRHGTSSQTLAQGAGHLYGTTLPVGGEGTNAVIAAHTGMVRRLMFDNLTLGKAHLGDHFTITTLGKELHYTVRDIKTIEPTDASFLLPTPGQDKVTLLTCTPYGLGTHRLLVIGERDESWAQSAPSTTSLTQQWTHTEWVLVCLIAGIWIMWLITMFLWATGFRITIPWPRGGGRR